MRNVIVCTSSRNGYTYYIVFLARAENAVSRLCLPQVNSASFAIQFLLQGRKGWLSMKTPCY